MTTDVDEMARRANTRVARTLKPKKNPVSHRGEKSASRPESEIGPDLLEMNSRFAVVRVGGKTRVVSLEDSVTYPGCKVPVFSTIQDFVAFHARRKFDQTTGRQVGIGRWWIAQEARRQYDGIVYAPNTDDPTKLNLWTGFACEARSGDCSRYLRHVHDNVCSGNDHYAEYLLSWLARAVQQPGNAGEVAVILRGKEGVGKGVFAREFGRLFGSHFRHVVHAKHLTGHFNSHLQQCSVLYADEAFFAGDRGHESTLKGLITEETMMIEPKGVDPFSVRNCIHLLMSSNADWVVPAGADARRYFVLDVSDAQMQRAEYFGAIAEQMNDGGREALLHHLLNRDLAKFDVRHVPQTQALAEQKRHSRRGVDQLIEIIANDGIVPRAHDDFANVAITSGEEKGRGFYVAARALVHELKFRSSPVIAHELMKHWGCMPWKDAYRRGISFPMLTNLRRLFDVRHGPQPWPEMEEWGKSEELKDVGE